MCFAPQGRALFRHLNFQKCSKREVFLAFSLCASRHNCVHFFDISTPKNGPDLVCFVHFDFEMCFAPQQRALFRHLNFQKCSERDVFLTFFHCASRYNGVHFFDISTPKNGPDLVLFVHFDFEMCFAPQGRALFRHLNFQKWSGPGVFCTLWLRNVLRTTTACTFSTSQLPKVVRTCRFFWLFHLCFAPQRRAPFRHVNFQKWSGPVVFCTLWRASRHNGVHFFDISTSKSGPDLVCFVHFDFEMCFAPKRRAIFHLSSASGLRTRRFSEPTFRPSGATNHWKNSVSRLSYLFAHLDLLSSETFSFLIFFTLLFSSLTLPISAFHLSIVSEVWLLNFLG